MPKVLVLGAFRGASYFDDVKSKLESSNYFSQIDYFSVADSTPTLNELNAYDAILLSTDNSPYDQPALSDTVATYLDMGGALVNAAFSNSSVTLGGRFDSEYAVIIPGNQDDGTEYTLGTVNDPTSPLMHGVSAFDGGSSSYRAANPSLVSGAVVVAEWSDGQPLVVYKTNMGPANVTRVDLNFYPPSSDVSSDFWVSSTDGALLLSNALAYVAGASIVTSTALQEQVTLASAYPNPSNGNFTLSLDAKSDVNTTVKIMNMYGQTVYSKELSFNSGLNAVEISTGLPKGMYVLNLASKEQGANKIVVE